MTCECKPTTTGGHEDEDFYPLTTLGFQVDQIDCICEALYQSRDGDRLVRMFRRDPSILTFRTNAVLRAYLFTLYSNGNFEQFFLEMSKNKFDPAYHKELVGLWYEAKYADEERRRRKTLGPVDKYRIRKKNPPPRTIWDGQEEKYSFKAPARKVLKSYYESNPYPTAADKREIEMRTGLHATQIQNWFKNRRQRDKTGTRHIADGPTLTIRKYYKPERHSSSSSEQSPPSNMYHIH